MLYNVLIWFIDQENIGLDPQIMILHEAISEILEISDFEAAIFKNGRNGARGPPLAHGLKRPPITRSPQFSRLKFIFPKSVKKSLKFIKFVKPWSPSRFLIANTYHIHPSTKSQLAGASASCCQAQSNILSKMAAMRGLASKWRWSGAQPKIFFLLYR